MSNLYDKILNDIKESMKTKDPLKRDCLRCIVSEIKNLTVNAGKDISEEICIKIILKSVKLHYDSIKNFTEGNRLDLVEKEEKELAVLKNYLPKMYSEIATLTLILKIICDNKIPEVKKSFGLIMKLLNLLPDKDLIDKKIVSLYLNVLLK